MNRLATIAVFALLASGCAAGRDDANRPPPNEAVLALLGNARALHHEADVYEGAGDYARAADAVRRILGMEIPRSMAEAEDLRADAYGRLSELALRRAAPDEALSLADTGLRDTHRESVLRGRLLRVRGQSLAAMADRAHAAGDEAAATRYRGDAIAALEDSIALNARIVARLTHGGAR